jgi:hypothetical protein
MPDGKKTEKGQTKTEKKRFTLGLTTSFSPGTGLFSVDFLVLSILIPVPSSLVMPLATNVWERCHTIFCVRIPAVLLSVDRHEMPKSSKREACMHVIGYWIGGTNRTCNSS